MNDEQLESLLQAASESAEPLPDLPENLARLVRQRRSRKRMRSRRITFVTAVTGCYVAGLLTAWWAHGLTERWNRSVGKAKTEYTPKLVADSPPASMLEAHDSTLDRREHKQTGEQKKLEQLSPYAILREMGDENWQRNDFQAAVVYYGQALDVATSNELEISYVHDNWLLASLKQDRKRSTNEPASGDTS